MKNSLKIYRNTSNTEVATIHTHNSNNKYAIKYLSYYYSSLYSSIGMSKVKKYIDGKTTSQIIKNYKYM